LEFLSKAMELQSIKTNITGRDEHVPEVARYIRALKERRYNTVNILPVEKLPHQLFVKKVYNALFWLLLPPHGIHSTLSTWYHLDASMDILSLINLQKKYKVTYERFQRTVFVVHKVGSTTVALYLCAQKRAMLI